MLAFRQCFCRITWRQAFGVLAIANAGRGRRAPLIFMPIAFASGFLYEALSITTGFPFGFFQHGNSLGVKLGVVPVVVAMSYFFLDYPANSIKVMLDIADV